MGALRDAAATHRWSRKPRSRYPGTAAGAGIVNSPTNRATDPASPSIWTAGSSP